MLFILKVYAEHINTPAGREINTYTYGVWLKWLSYCRKSKSFNEEIKKINGG